MKPAVGAGPLSEFSEEARHSLHRGHGEAARSFPAQTRALHDLREQRTIRIDLPMLFDGDLAVPANAVFDATTGFPEALRFGTDELFPCSRAPSRTRLPLPDNPPGKMIPHDGPHCAA